MSEKNWTMNEGLAHIRELEAKADQLQSEQKLSECLSVLEEVLHLKREEFGEENEYYLSTSHKLSEICNIIAMIFLNKDKPDSCLEFLRRAEALATGSSLFKAITYNNMAQYCKKTNKLKTAVQYLEKAQEIQIKQGNPVLLADTHLNLCALFSQQDRHSDALEQILVAVVLLQEEYSSLLLKQLKAEQDDNQREGKEKGQQLEDEDEDLFSKLAIAYHNLGVEFEFLKRFEESLQTYEKAVNFSRTNLGPQHELTKQFETVFASAQQTISETRQKEAMKKKPNNSRGIPASQIYSTLEPKKHASNNSTTKAPNTANKSKRIAEVSERNINQQSHLQPKNSNTVHNRQNSQDQGFKRQSSQNSQNLN